MRSATLIRHHSTDDGTFGTFTLDNGKTFASGELPWQDNQNGISCIPCGTYTCKWIDSPKHGECYQITNVPQRDMIEIHSANWMGDTHKGKISQLRGCVALGSEIGILSGQRAILSSKKSISEFEADMNKADFQLVIKEEA